MLTYRRNSFSVQETQQPFSHMAKDLKLSLRNKLEQIAPEYGLVELTYPSFTRCYGYLSPPVSAGDAVEALSALIDVAGGIRMEVEIEGTRNGGEWFGGGRLWQAGGREDDKENRGVLFSGVGASVNEKPKANEEEGDEDDEEEEEVQWWVRNFWTAYDALTEYVSPSEVPAPSLTDRMQLLVVL